jgi:hypothetical protein
MCELLARIGWRAQLPQSTPTVMDLEVESCAAPVETEPEVIDYWSKRIADVTWAAARPSWQQGKRALLPVSPIAPVPAQFEALEAVHTP